ncbi:hypothetical protein CYMTET_38767 [Cymbomonas tetramitiformis]|uniref:Uncharacterized protein n=1 Tax=Cymbomonas tetramitiformis TaxID=36881 RepID=A0AAE0F558_9CHLO|nr:hypothetical protein CYMTET_38767 [Cymbomonas tetramitiformis]
MRRMLLSTRSLEGEDAKPYFNARSSLKKSARWRVLSVLGAIDPDTSAASIRCASSLGRYANGNVRSASEYLEFCGVDYMRRRVLDKAKTGGLPATHFNFAGSTSLPSRWQTGDNIPGAVGARD